MTRYFRVICGPPRSGSTLLRAAAREPGVPRRHDQLGGHLVGASVELINAGRQAALLVTIGQKRAIVRGLVDS